jgi:hypothetical protein
MGCSFQILLLFWTLVVVGCVTNAPAPEKATKLDAETVTRHMDRLLVPFQKGTTIYCQKLTVEVSAAFAYQCGFPAGGTKEQGEGYEQVVWQLNDEVKIRPKKGESAPLAESRKQKFHVVIGTNHFVVDRFVRLKKLLVAPPTLTAMAAGHVLVVRDAKHIDKYQELQFADGRVRAR